MGIWRNNNLTYYCKECKIVEALYKQLLLKFIHLPYDSEISLLGMYIKEMKTYIHKKNYAEMIIAVLFIIRKKQKTGSNPDVWIVNE